MKLGWGVKGWGTECKFRVGGKGGRGRRVNLEWGVKGFGEGKCKFRVGGKRVGEGV